MLELSKQILQKVSFDRLLFEKELRKATKWVSKEELQSLRKWCLVTFGAIYSDVIVNVFDNTIR